MKLKLITAQEAIFDGEVDSVTVPGELGEFQVLPGHTEFIGLVQSGTLSFSGSGGQGVYSVGPGHAEVIDGVLTVAVDSAEVTP